ncbi:hypothetical protein PENTCL1PPCAC_2772, partial [Pristionchus entomophagus]
SLHDHIGILIVRVEQDDFGLASLQLGELLIDIRHVCAIDDRLEDYFKFYSLLDLLHFISQRVSELLVSSHLSTDHTE